LNPTSGEKLMHKEDEEKGVSESLSCGAAKKLRGKNRGDQDFLSVLMYQPEKTQPLQKKLIVHYRDRPHFTVRTD